MLIPIGTDYRMSTRPVVNYAIVFANVLLFVLQYVNAFPVDAYLLHPDDPQLHQFFSCMFLHGGWSHLIGNMIFLWVFGNAINDRFGHVGYLAFYLSGGVLSAIGYLSLGATAPVMGASGAIAAVTGAYLVLLPRVRVSLLAWLLYMLIPFEVSSLYFLAFQFAFNVYSSFSAGLSGVAYTAHASGYVFGIGVAAILLALRVLPRDPYDLLNLIRSYRRRKNYRHLVEEGFDPFRTRPYGGRRVPSRAVGAATPNTIDGRELALRRDITEYCNRHDLTSAADQYARLLEIDPHAVLPRQQQLDVANQLMALERYPAAAAAYEAFIGQYGDYPYLGDIYLMLGLLYRRYIPQYDQAARYLNLAIETLRDEAKSDMARAELAAIQR